MTTNVQAQTSHVPAPGLAPLGNTSGSHAGSEPSFRSNHSNRSSKYSCSVARRAKTGVRHNPVCFIRVQKDIDSNNTTPVWCLSEVNVQIHLHVLLQLRNVYLTSCSQTRQCLFLHKINMIWYYVSLLTSDSSRVSTTLIDTSASSGTSSLQAETLLLNRVPRAAASRLSVSTVLDTKLAFACRCVLKTMNGPLGVDRVAHPTPGNKMAWRVKVGQHVGELILVVNQDSRCTDFWYANFSQSAFWDTCTMGFKYNQYNKRFSAKFSHVCHSQSHQVNSLNVTCIRRSLVVKLCAAHSMLATCGGDWLRSLPTLTAGLEHEDCDESMQAEDSQQYKIVSM